jgi:hypothetical protein
MVSRRALMLTAFAIIAFAQVAWSAEYDWSLVRMGGKEVNDTLATGTNDAGWIVGNWHGHADPSNPGGAFRFAKKQFIPFAVPGAVRTEVADIESSSTIVGNAWDANGVMWAFLYRHGVPAYDRIDIPGAFLVYPFRVNKGRQVAVGYWYQADGGGIFWGAGLYDWTTKETTPVEVFGSTDLVIRGINNRGELVGSYAIPDPDCPSCQLWDFGFYRDAAGQVHELIAPDGAAVVPNAINDHGMVVGRVHDSGFRWDLTTGAFEEIAHPVRRGDGFWTEIVDIDTTGRMVAVSKRLEDAYHESHWVRPIKPAPKPVAKR